MSNIRDNEMNNRTMALLRTMSNMAMMIKLHLPVLGDIITSSVDACANEFVEYSNKQNQQLLVGEGPRASTLKQIEELFPDKDIETFIQENLPKVYPITDSEISEFNNYVNFKLLNSSIDSSFDNPGWLNRIESENLGAMYRGERISEFLGFESMPGFYKHNNRDNYYSSWSLVLHVENVTYILSSAYPRKHVILVKVPIENTVATTEDYKYVHVGDLRTAFDNLLKESNLFQEKEVYLDNLFEEISSKLIDKNVRFLDSEEIVKFNEKDYVHSTVLNKLSSGLTHELAWSEDSLRFWDQTDPGIEYTQIYTNIVLKTRTDMITISRINKDGDIKYSYRTLKGNLETRFNSSSDRSSGHGFDAIPVLIRKGIREAFLSVIEKMPVNQVSDTDQKQE